MIPYIYVGLKDVFEYRIIDFNFWSAARSRAESSCYLRGPPKPHSTHKQPYKNLEVRANVLELKPTIKPLLSFPQNPAMLMICTYPTADFCH